MAKNKSSEKEIKSARKLNRQMVEQRLEDSFSDLKTIVGKNRFAQTIKKAGKLITANLSKKTFEQLRKVKEENFNTGNQPNSEAHAAINDLP
ncbi:MAG: hypothetical protein WKF89_06550 [Chitinophagaceae bacterium]